MATIRQWLDDVKFDWKSGRIIFQEVKGSDCPGWHDPTSAEIINAEHPVLDQTFDDGFGGPECPRFVAEDSARIYFPTQYDGATELMYVWKDIELYLNFSEHPSPYPGG